ncbi:MAG: peptidyl-tRNA hydrolase [Acidimicrobiia bacterium]|nr:peptidyl-tRNA hydrolase [Acidimicrobiia bacterium]
MSAPVPADAVPADAPERRSADASPRALQVVVRLERGTAPAVADVCGSVSAAVLALLDDDAARPGGAWADAVAAWRDGRIRKLVRRARGEPWRRVQLLDGVTVQRGDVEARALVPAPMDEAPPELARLQIQSTALDPPQRLDAIAPAGAATMTIALTPLVDMSWGKRAAQCAHAAQLLWERSAADQVRAWVQAGRPIEVVFPTSPCWAELADAAPVHVHDGGFTEVEPGTHTALSWWRGPDSSRAERIDPT